MQKFLLGNDNFGIGKIDFKIDRKKGLLSLTLPGDQDLFDKLSENEDGPWGWALYPPKLYFHELPFDPDEKTIRLRIDEELLDSCDIALYLMEHNDVEGDFEIDADNRFRFSGIAWVSGEETTLEVDVQL